MMGLPNCSDVTAQLSREHDCADRQRRAIKVRLHLLICGACRRYGRYLEWMHDNIPRALGYAPGARLLPLQRRQIRQFLYDQLP